MPQRDITTHEAFAQLLERPDLWRRTGRKMQQRLTFRNKLKIGEGITLDLKETILAEAGYIIKQVTLWGEP